MLQLFWPIAKIDRDERLVYGYASTEAPDSQGEIVRKEALEAALPAYMRFANIREMHQPSAVGVAKEAVVDDKGLWLKAHIVDDVAWRKVTEGVYKGFSIGGLVTARDEHAPNIITGVDVTEISLVDRPANPEAILAVWKSAGGSPAGTDVRKEITTVLNTDPAALKAARAKLAQKWVSTDGSAFDRAEDAARHEAGVADPGAAAFTAACASLTDSLAKTTTFAPASEPTSGLTHYDLDSADEGKGDGAVDFADPGYQADKKKRYPIDDERHIRAAWIFINQQRNEKPYTEAQLDSIKARIVAAWKAKIDKDDPPTAKIARATSLHKGMQEVARLACLVEELEWLRETVAAEQADEADQSTVPADLQDVLTRLCAVLRAMVDEETAELLDDDTDEEGEPVDQSLARAAASLAPGRASALLKLVRGARLANANLPKLVAALAKIGARHSQADFSQIQKIHDSTVELGAVCDGGPDTDEKRAGGEFARLAARNAALEERLGAAVPLILQVKALVEKVAAQPAVMPPHRLTAIDKGADVARELERIAEQPPAVTAFELIRRAVKEPLPFGSKLPG
jgi:hypothetical protein